MAGLCPRGFVNHNVGVMRGIDLISRSPLFVKWKVTLMILDWVFPVAYIELSVISTRKANS